MEADELLLTVGLQLFNILHLNCFSFFNLNFSRLWVHMRGEKGFSQKKTLRIVQGIQVVGHKKRVGICASFRIMDIQKVLGRGEFIGFIYMKTLKIILIFEFFKMDWLFLN